jgi:hypothetical protein
VLNDGQHAFDIESIVIKRPLSKLSVKSPRPHRKQLDAFIGVRIALITLQLTIVGEEWIERLCSIRTLLQGDLTECTV